MVATQKALLLATSCVIMDRSIDIILSIHTSPEGWHVNDMDNTIVMIGRHSYERL